MNCPICSRPNPEDARFCIHCAAPLEAREQPPVVEAATGSTVALNAPTDIPTPAAAAAQPRPSTGLFPAGRTKELTGALWLIGLGILFVTNTFWPGVLVLAGLTAYLNDSARGRQVEALRPLLTLTGMAVLFQFGLFWPGILILLGVVALLSPELRGHRAF